MPGGNENDEIVITAPRFITVYPADGGGGGSGGGGGRSGGPVHYYAAYVPSNLPDIFAEVGGGEVAQVAQFALIDGNVVVTLPGYDFKLKIPAADWARMSASEKGAFIKVMSEFHESPKLVEALNHLQAEGVADVVVRYGTSRYRIDGGRESFEPDQHGFIAYEAREIDGRVVDTNITAGSTVVISINSSLVNGASEFATTLMHELRHPVVPGTGFSEENLVGRDDGVMYDDIFRGSSERSVSDYFEGVTFIGSRHDDNATGSNAGDTLSGLSGNDVLDGAAGDDLVLGGVGMDRLTGGAGNDLLMGGLDADTYGSAAGAILQTIVDTGGVDQLDLSRFSLSDAVFSRDGNSLIIRVFGATQEEYVIQDHWLAQNKVEQFIFADGTYAASYMEYLADNSGGTGVCYDAGQPVICGPYGMPVVLDLDGDGIELISVDDSKARFDVDGDGTRDRIGWVSADDGILALDRNGNGRIDDFSEISFLQDFLGAGSDLEGLYAYDSNGDGFLTAADDGFGEFLVWQDRNGNGHSEKKELFSLDELGIVSISLERSNVQELDLGVSANQVLATSTFETSDGRISAVGDVALFIEYGGSECGCATMTPSLSHLDMP